jgi:hypothetical protein
MVEFGNTLVNAVPPPGGPDPPPAPDTTLRVLLL